MALSLITAPAIEPISIEDARLHARIFDGAEDALLNAYIVAARHQVEAITGRQLIEATWEDRRDEICGDLIHIPRPPLRAVLSVKYLDMVGVQQTWSSALYQVDKPAGPFARLGRLAPLPTATWPLAGSGFLNAIVVQFTAGYGTTPEDVPEAIRQAMRLMIGAWSENREDVLVGSTPQSLPLPVSALALLTPYKVYA